MRLKHQKEGKEWYQNRVKEVRYAFGERVSLVHKQDNDQSSFLSLATGTLSCLRYLAMVRLAML